ncbi:membrane protein TerC, possibly involved in tellurium resistance [Caldisphaera lagunensis DSM 15908]|uniref:Membrane protein TerC, possibly involved in tellurium resistance n=1 Tax=Caldisphaera lagunensis (strain DSM 15908 / JCM 11604 / ANMR 0165 / IC-154) TaxID=1056495 RepID=L0ABL1_CALLD|nr:membrane protein TerC, possibly involved in tellurium resistance [Caldisphaera lagunensis DSM 15908]
MITLILFGISIEFLFKKNFKYIILIWIALSLVYFMVLFIRTDFYESYLFLTSYLLEISLSLDNILVFLLIFTQFSISFEHQEKLVAIGSYSAIVLRFLFVYAGIELLNVFELGTIILSLLVLFSAFELAREEFNNEKEKEESNIIKFFKKYLKTDFSNNEFSFFVKKNGKIVPTKYLLVIFVIEISDIIFAFDSIPAIILITKNELIAYSSTIFGTLIIRSLYFNVNRSLSSIKHIEGFLAIGLGYIGISSLINSINKFIKTVYIPEYISVIVVVLIIAFGLLYSFLNNRMRTSKQTPSQGPGD